MNNVFVWTLGEVIPLTLLALLLTVYLGLVVLAWVQQALGQIRSWWKS